MGRRATGPSPRAQLLHPHSLHSLLQRPQPRPQGTPGTQAAAAEALSVFAQTQSVAALVPCRAVPQPRHQGRAMPSCAVAPAARGSGASAPRPPPQGRGYTGRRPLPWTTSPRWRCGPAWAPSGPRRALGRSAAHPQGACVRVADAAAAAGARGAARGHPAGGGRRPGLGGLCRSRGSGRLRESSAFQEARTCPAPAPAPAPLVTSPLMGSCAEMGAVQRGKGGASVSRSRPWPALSPCPCPSPLGTGDRW